MFADPILSLVILGIGSATNHSTKYALNTILSYPGNENFSNSLFFVVQGIGRMITSIAVVAIKTKFITNKAVNLLFIMF